MSFSNFFFALLSIHIIVAIHEWGHFIVARIYSVAVQEYAIGFGPVLWQRKCKKGYYFSIRWLPLGGYVKFAEDSLSKNNNNSENHNLEDQHTINKNVSDSSNPQFFANTSYLKQSQIYLAGPFMNFILSILCFFTLYAYGMKVPAPIIQNVHPHSIAAQAKFKPKQAIIAIHGKKIHTWRELFIALTMHIHKPSPLVLTAKDLHDGSIQNYYLNLKNIDLYHSDSILDAVGMIPYSPKIYLRIKSVVDFSPAAIVGLQPEDKLESFNGQKVNQWKTFQKKIIKNPQKTVQIGWYRPSEQRHYLKNVTLDWKMRKTHIIGYLGVTPQYDSPASYSMKYVQLNPLQALIYGLNTCYQLNLYQFRLIGFLFTQTISTQLLIGPIGIIQNLAHASEIGWQQLLENIALLSIAVGFINLLPFPILDGGQWCIATFETLRRKKLQPIQRWLIDRIGLITILALMAHVLILDLTR
jgi:regulator of sigma E protease